MSTFCFEIGSGWPRNNRASRASAEIKGSILRYSLLGNHSFSSTAIFILTGNPMPIAESKEGHGQLFLPWDLTSEGQGMRSTKTPAAGEWVGLGWFRGKPLRLCHWFWLGLPELLYREEKGPTEASPGMCGLVSLAVTWYEAVSLSREDNRRTILLPPLPDFPSASVTEPPSDTAGAAARSWLTQATFWTIHSHLRRFPFLD